MALAAGTVTVASDESATGSGVAKAIYDADLASMTAASMLPAVPTVGATTFPYTSTRPANADDVTNIKAARLVLLRESARRATAWAAGFVPYFAANGNARVKADTTGDGLQNGTTHPTADKLIPLE